jgi:hypothetical protein
MTANDYPPGFQVALHLKDLAIALSMARSTGTVLPVTALVSQLEASLVALGHGGRFQTVSGKPARAMSWAIAPPIVPSPATPIRSMFVTSFLGCDFVRRGSWPQARPSSTLGNLPASVRSGGAPSCAYGNLGTHLRLDIERTGCGDARTAGWRRPSYGGVPRSGPASQGVARRRARRGRRRHTDRRLVNDPAEFFAECSVSSNQGRFSFSIRKFLGGAYRSNRSASAGRQPARNQRTATRGRLRGDIRLRLVRRPARRRRCRHPHGPSTGDQGHRRGPGEERRGRRPDARPPVANEPPARGLDRAARGPRGPPALARPDLTRPDPVPAHGRSLCSARTRASDSHGADGQQQRSPHQ